MAINRYDLTLPMLAVPQLLSTTSGRPWLIDIFSVSNSVKLMTFFPALMATILLFMDQNITVRLIIAKRNKLKKNYGIHLDMLAVAISTTITSLLGMPWMVAATVRSLAHLRSLTEYSTPVPADSTAGSPATAPVPTGVLEQRLSGLSIHTLIGGSILMCRPLLRRIPVSVLTGLFLYLGMSSIDKTEMWDRFLLFFTTKEDAPKNAWVTEAGINKTRLFTAIQVFVFL